MDRALLAQETGDAVHRHRLDPRGARPGAEPPRRLNATVPDSRPSTATRSTTMPSTSPAPPSTGLPLAPGLTGENSNSSVAEPPPCGAVMPLNTVLARAGMRCNSPYASVNTGRPPLPSGVAAKRSDRA